MTDTTVRTAHGELRVSVDGDGPPVLLLHGFPQTRLAWRAVVPRLADRFTLVRPDLPGYGESPAPEPDEPGSWSKRRTAAAAVALMRELGHERFAVVGHDRGGLVAFRAALDHPDAVTHLGVLDILPTVDSWAALTGPAGVFAFHLYLLATPPDLPERLVGAAPDVFFGHFLDTWTTVPGAIDAPTRAHYLAACGRPEVVHAICQDYRASAFVDGGHDRADRDAHRRITQPTLALWQDPGDVVLPFDPEAVWRSWAPDLVTGTLDCGHFLPEERPAEVADAITALVGR